MVSFSNNQNQSILLETSNYQFPNFDGVNNSRYIFHYLHSMDRFFINPEDYVYEGEKLFGIPENLSVWKSQLSYSLKTP